MKLSEIGTPIQSLSGVGPNTAKLFAKLNIFTVADLLSFWPRDWDDRTSRVPLSEFASGKKVHTVCKVTAHDWFGYGKMRTLKIAITDGSAHAWLIAFNRPFLEKSLPQGSIIAVTGHFDVKYNSLQSTAFEAECLSYSGNLEDFAHISIPGTGLLPIYPLTEGLSQKNVRKAVLQALKLYAKGIDDEIPDEIKVSRHLLSKREAVFFMHCPQSLKELQKARHTLIYEELYTFEYKMALRILAHRGSLPEENALFEKSEGDNDAPEAHIPNAAPFFSTPLISAAAFEKQLSPRQKQLYKRLPFSLTDGQMAAIFQMNGDIDKSQTEWNAIKSETAAAENKKAPFSMQRLLQGDVGSGKTLVAFFVCLRTVDYGGQCAILAPTELLARQHAENAARQLEILNVRIAFLTGNLKASGRAPLLAALKDGTIHIVLGTHALFSQNVQYKNLQLAVIDEQHRFGVAQREAIIAKGRETKGSLSHAPDVLMMSATPIPQTLALTVFGDLDVSTIRSMPNGRKPIKTFLSVMGHEKNVYDAVRKELDAGHQAYFVYPRIADTAGAVDQSPHSQDDSGLKSAEEMVSFLQKEVYPTYTCALIHSKIDEEEQNTILADFRKNTIQVLVATTVVEVGVDVPNATCIVIEHADRFGLSALHQLRGRVGRGEAQSYCFLIYAKNITEDGIQRMKALRQSSDGFEIAEKDLELRGPGEVLGTAQSGYLTLGLADLARDKTILTQARYDAFTAVRNAR